MEDLVAAYEKAEEARQEREQSEGAKLAKRIEAERLTPCSYLAELETVDVPVAMDPDEVLATATECPDLYTDPGHWPVGTWFYYGAEYVGVKTPDGLVLKRKRPEAAG